MLIKVYAEDEYAKQLNEVIREVIVSLAAQHDNLVLIANLIIKKRREGFDTIMTICGRDSVDQSAIEVVQIDQFDDGGYCRNLLPYKMKNKLVEFYDMDMGW